MKKLKDGWDRPHGHKIWVKWRTKEQVAKEIEKFVRNPPKAEK